MNSIEIPVGKGEEVLEVGLNDLDGNDENIINILQDERSELGLFLRFAFEYYSRGMTREFESFLVAGKGAAERLNRVSEEPVRILLLNTLASHYIELAKSPGSERSAEELIGSATQLLKQSEELSKLDPLTSVVKANLMMRNNQLDQAAYNFNGALDRKPNFVPALIGLAGCHFAQGDYKASLSRYQRILQTVPNIKPDVRIPIALCFIKLGMLNSANKALERASALDPENVTALALSCLLDLNRAKDTSLSEAKKQALVKSANQKLIKGFQLNAKHSIIANQMGERFLQKGTLDKAMVFAETALRNSLGGQGRADALLLKARIYQSQEEYDRAFDIYLEASNEFPNSMLLLFGLGQMHLYKGNFKESITCFEKLLEKEPNNYDSLQILGHLYGLESDSVGKATECYQKIKRLVQSYREDQYDTELADEDLISDPLLLIEMGILYEKSDLRQAGRVYGSALRLLQSTESDIPPELRNNLAALFQIDAEVSKNAWVDGVKDVVDDAADQYRQAISQAESLYQEALLSSSAELVGQERSEAIQSVARFNVARLYESNGDFEKSEHQYTELLKKHPTFIDCWLRLADKEISSGNFEKAFEYIGQAIRVDPKSSSAWNLLATAHLKNSNFRSARKCFEKVLQDMDRYDTYALTGCGNICLTFARTDPGQRGIHWKRAVEFFSKALRQAPQNMYAAEGIAIAFAERGKFEAAKICFTQVLEGSRGLPVVNLNLAHSMVEMGDVRSAVAIYEGILTKPSHFNNVELLMAASRAYYIAGRTESDPTLVAKAARLAQRAAHIEPSTLRHFYNLALLKQQHSNLMNELPLEKRSLPDMRKGSLTLVSAEKIFGNLANLNVEHAGYDTKKAVEQAVYAKNIRKVTERKIHETSVLEKIRLERVEELRLRKEQQQEEERRESEFLLQKQLAEQADIEAKRKALQLKIQEENEKMRVYAETEKNRPKRVASSDDDNVEPAEPKKLRKKIKVKPLAKPAPESSDEESPRIGDRGLLSSKSNAIITHSDEDEE